MPGTHLDSDTRSQFNILKGENRPMAEIATILNRSASTLYREQNRVLPNCDHYCPLKANIQAIEFKGAPRKKRKNTTEYQLLVQAGLEEGMSPDCIRGRQQLKLKDYQQRLEARQGVIDPKDPEPLQIGTNAIYNIIAQDRKEGGTLYNLLPRAGKIRRRHPTSGSGAGRLPVKPEQEIQERPVSINKRNVPGHWEVDLVFSGPTIFFTATDRFTRLSVVSAISSKESDVVAEELTNLCYKYNVRTITTDRGLEWSGFQKVVDTLAVAGIQVNLYFCKPYHSWEKGSIENFNGLLRRYFPKKESLEWHEGRRAEAKEAERKLNNLPRKGLGYKTPVEVQGEWTRKMMEELWKGGMTPPRKAAA